MAEQVGRLREQRASHDEGLAQARADYEARLAAAETELETLRIEHARITVGERY